jgi:hypothetical protein
MDFYVLCVRVDAGANAFSCRNTRCLVCWTENISFDQTHFHWLHHSTALQVFMQKREGESGSDAARHVETSCAVFTRSITLDVTNQYKLTSKYYFYQVRRSRHLV